MLAGDRDRVLAVLDKFDAVFAVIGDHDAEPTRAALAWAEQQGFADKVSAGLIESQAFSNDAIEALIAERNTARKRRDFKRSDEIRDELASKGIILEDAKDGVRWKRK